MVYIRINKSGSTSIFKMVEGYCKVLYYNPTKRENALGGWLDRSMVSLRPENCFTVTRDPYARAVSCYHHCLRNGFKYRGGLTEWLQKDFCMMKTNERAHSLPQVEYIKGSNGSVFVPIRHTFKLEEMYLEQKIQHLTGTPRPLERLAPGDYEPPTLTEEQIALINLKYEKDFIAFNYNFKY